MKSLNQLEVPPELYIMPELVSKLLVNTPIDKPGALKGSTLLVLIRKREQSIKKWK